MSEPVNVARYRQRAYRKKKVLAAFLKKLVRKAPADLSKVRKQAEAHAWQKVNCQSCGNCCKTMTPTWKKSEVQKLAAHLGMTYQEFYDKWLYTEEGTGDIMNASTPCQFFDLKKGLCKVYHLRPHDCATFPHLYRRDFNDQVDLYTANLHRCPATLEAMEFIHRAYKDRL